MKRTYLLCLLFFSSSLLVAQPLFQLESTFGNNGQAIIPIGPSSSNVAQDRSYQIAQQSDGKIILAGYSNDIGGTEDWIIAVVRLHPTGGLDQSFGVNGVSKIDFASGDDEGWAVGVQADDKLVITGRIWMGSSTKMGVVRLTADGQLDPTFNGTGKALHEIGSSSDEGFDLAIQPDQKILAVGRSWLIGGETGWGLMRLLPNGQLDTSFNGTGKFYYNSGFYDEMANCVRLQDDHKILLGGSINGSPAIIRLLPDGTFDPSFNVVGISSIAISGSVTSMRVDSLGRIVFSAYAYDGICKTGRLMPDGTPDLGFGNGGISIFNSNQNSFYRSYDEVILLPDGKILGMGCFENLDPFDYTTQLTLLLLDENGEILESFMSNPDMQLHLCSYNIRFLHATLLDDGTIGITSPSCILQSNYDMLAAKLKYNRLTTSFDLIPLKEAIAVYPNPTTGELRVDNVGAYQSDFIWVYDALGRMVSRKKIDQETMTVILPENVGTYFIKVGNAVKKVLKVNPN